LKAGDERGFGRGLGRHTGGQHVGGVEEQIPARAGLLVKLIELGLAKRVFCRCHLLDGARHAKHGLGDLACLHRLKVTVGLELPLFCLPQVLLGNRVLPGDFCDQLAGLALPHIGERAELRQCLDAPLDHARAGGIHLRLEPIRPIVGLPDEGFPVERIVERPLRLLHESFAHADHRIPDVSADL